MQQVSGFPASGAPSSHVQAAAAQPIVPLEIDHNNPSELKGMTVYKAIGHVATENGFQVTSIKGKFPQEGGVVQADLYKSGNDQNFKFDVTFVATIKTATGEEKKVTFTQTIYTDVKVPTGYDIHEFANAKTEAYQVAKSFELLQRNLSTPHDPVERTGIQEHVTDVQLKALKNETSFTFQKLEQRGPSEHTIVPLQARSVKSDTVLPPLNLTADKTNKNSGAVFSRLEIMERKQISCDYDKGIPLSRYENNIRNQDLPNEELDADKIEYPKFLQAKSEHYENKINAHYQIADNQLRDTNETLKKPEMQELKQEYKDLQNKIASNPNPQERKQLGNRQKEILSKMGISNLEDSLKEMKKLYNEQVNVNRQLIQHNRDNIPNMKKLNETQVEKIGRVEKEIAALKAGLLQPGTKRSQSSGLSEDSDFESMDENYLPSGSPLLRRTDDPTFEMKLKPINPAEKQKERTIIDKFAEGIKNFVASFEKRKEPVPDEYKFFHKLNLENLDVSTLEPHHKDALVKYIYSSSETFDQGLGLSKEEQALINQIIAS